MDPETKPRPEIPPSGILQPLHNYQINKSCISKPGTVPEVDSVLDIYFYLIIRYTLSLSIKMYIYIYIYEYMYIYVCIYIYIYVS